MDVLFKNSHFTTIYALYWGIVLGFSIAICSIENCFKKNGDFSLTKKWEELPEWYKKAKYKMVIFIAIGVALTIGQLIIYLFW